MALSARLKTAFGEERDLYIRINNVEASNHGAPSLVTLRGYVSEEAFEKRANFVWEKSMEFTADPAVPIWEQAYKAVKQDPDLSEAIDC